MLKFSVFVLISLIQITMVLTFIFPDDDYFKQTKSTVDPRYETSTRLNRFTTRRTPSTTRLNRFKTRPTPNTTRRNRFTTSRTPTTSINDINIDIAIFNSCMASCPTTTEYDPICGTDGDNYPNRSTLGCVRRCGIDVQMVRLGRC